MKTIIELIIEWLIRKLFRINTVVKMIEEK